jgi:hypothetical protein
MKTYLKWIEEQFDALFCGESSTDFFKAYEAERERQNALKSSLKKNMHNGIQIRISTHAASQAKVRRSDLTPDDWSVILDRVTARIKSDKLAHGDYLFYSKSYEEGLILNWNGVRGMIITVLPKSRQNTKPGTIKQLIEEAGRIYTFRTCKLLSGEIYID